MAKMRVLFVTMCIMCATVYSEQSDNKLYSGVKVIFNAIQQCENSDLVTCLKIRVLRSLDKLLNEDEVRIVSGISFKKLPQEKSGRGITKPFNDFDEDRLPRDPKELTQTVDDLLMDRIIRFFKSHILKVDMENTFLSTGRGDKGGLLGGGGKKGGGGIFIIGGMMAAIAGAMTMTGIGLTAGTALLVAKMALVISAIIGLTKLSNSGGGESKYKVVGGYDRSGQIYRSGREVPSDHLVYSAHSPYPEN